MKIHAHSSCIHIHNCVIHKFKTRKQEETIRMDTASKSKGKSIFPQRSQILDYFRLVKVCL